jgi:SAM-dependent methyltransferase
MLLLCFSGRNDRAGSVESVTSTDLARCLREAYGAGAAAWAAGPVRMYRTLADVLVADAGSPVRGGLVIDLGAGTGAVSDAALAAGARAVVAVDAAEGMLRFAQRDRPPALVADGSALALGNEAVDAVLAGCCINHAPDPVVMVREAGRVVGPGGVVAMSTFLGGDEHPAKAIVDETMKRFGYELPSWHTAVKTEIAPLTETPGALEAVARKANLVDVGVREHRVDTGIRTARDLAGWRLGMASQSPFFSSLPPSRQEELVAACVEAIGPDPKPLIVSLLVLVARP